MSLSAKARWIIERNLGSDLTLEAIATACGTTRFHLAHAFGRVTGSSVMDYVRGRRLSEAARKLADGADDILGLALASGYDSHEAFSRAFKKRFGVTPQSIRQRGTIADLPLVTAPGDISPPRVVLPHPDLRDGDAIQAVGLERRYPFAATAGIAAQWQDFMTEHIHRIEGRLPGIPIGIATGLDEEDGFIYLAAAEVTSLATTPAGLTSLRIPPHRWIVYTHTRHIIELPSTYAAIWDYGLDAAGVHVDDAPSIERHLASFDPRTGEGGVEIWLPVTT